MSTPARPVPGAGAPRLVLYVYGRPPVPGGRPGGVDARPVLAGADGSVTMPRRDPGQPRALELQCLVLTAEAAPDGTLTRYGAGYQPGEPHVVDEDRAAAMLRTLRQLRVSLGLAAAWRGPPADFTDYLTRAAGVLGIPGPAPFAVHLSLSQGGPRWRHLSAAELRGWLPAQVRPVTPGPPGAG